MVIDLRTRRPLVQEPPYAEPDSGDASVALGLVIFGLVGFLTGSGLTFALLRLL